MVKTGILIKNELIKLKHRKVVWILAIILTVITVISALATAINTSSLFSYDLNSEAKYWEDMADNMESDDGYDGYCPSGVFDEYIYDELHEQMRLELKQMRIAECIKFASVCREANDAGITGGSDFRYGELNNNVLSNTYCSVLDDAIKAGKYGDTVEKVLSYLGIGKDEVSAIATLSDSELKRIEGMKFSDYITPLYTEAEAAYKNVLASAPSEDAPEYEKKTYENVKAAAKAEYDFYKYICDNELQYGSEMCTVALNGVSNAYELGTISYVSEREFEQDSSLHYDYSALIFMSKELTYNKYIRNLDKQTATAKNTLAVTYRCIETGKYDIGSGGSARNATFGYFSGSFLYLIYALVIFSTVLSSEYASRTIHMLVIRPVSRAKILTSKYLSAGIISLALYWAGAILHFLLSGIIHGFDDIGQSIYLAAFGGVIEIPYLLYYLISLVICSLSIIMLAMFAFMLTTTAKSGTAGIVLGSVIGVFSTAIANVLLMLFGQTVYSYNIFTYATVYGVINTGITTSSDFSLGDVFGGADINLLFGTVILCSLTVIFTLISHRRFARKDIK